MKEGKNESGYVLHTVLIILTVIAILFSLTLKYTGFTRKQASNKLHTVQAGLLAESGITRAEYFLNGGDGRSMEWETDRFEETIENYGTIIIKNRRFGLFSRIESQGKRLQADFTISGLWGRDIPGNLTPSLTLTGHVGGLILHEGSVVDGHIVLHHGDIYSERRGRPLAEYRKKLIVRESPKLPFDSLTVPGLIDDLERTRISFLSHSSGFTGNLTVDDRILNKDTIIVTGDCRIDKTEIRGKFLVVSGTLAINHGASIKDSELMAEKILIDGGSAVSSIIYSAKKLVVNGGYFDSQLFSKDTIFSSRGVKYGSMTLIAGLRCKSSTDSAVGGGVYFEEGTNFRGTVICCIDSSVKLNTAGPSIVFGKNSEISGAVITDHDLDIKESVINGSIWARTIMTRYQGMSFTNYLIKCRISRPETRLFFPLIGEVPVRVRGRSSEK